MVGVGAGAGASAREAPQALQKALPGGFVWLQLGQRASNWKLHELQKRASGGFSWPQDGQSTVVRPRSLRLGARQYCAELAALSTWSAEGDTFCLAHRALTILSE